MLSTRQYLQAMGIDVWERRELRQRRPVLAGTPVADESSTAQEPSRRTVNRITEPRETTRETTDVPAANSQPAPAVPRFRLGLYHYDSVGLCIFLGEHDELPRRLCDDVARIMGGDVEKLRFQELKWPMLETAGIDQSEHAAREVVTQKFRTLPDNLLVFGAGIANYFHPISSLTHMTPARVGTQTMLLVNDLQVFMTSAQEKRNLLRILHQWRLG